MFASSWLNAGVVGVAVTIVLVAVPLGCLALDPPDYDDPNWALAVLILGWLVAALVLVLAVCALLVGGVLWLRDRNRGN